MNKKEIIDKLLADENWDNRHKIYSEIECSLIPNIQQELRTIINTEYGIRKGRSDTIFFELDDERFSDRCKNGDSPIEFELDPYDQTSLIRKDFPEMPIRYEHIKQYIEKYPSNKPLQHLGKKAIKNIITNNEKNFRPQMTITTAHKTAKKIWDIYDKTNNIPQKIEMVKELIKIRDNFFYFRFPKSAEKRIIAESREMYELNDDDDYNPKNEDWEVLLVSRHYGQFHVRKDERRLEENDGRLHGYLYEADYTNWKPNNIDAAFIMQNINDIDNFISDMYVQTETFYDYITKNKHTEIE